MSFNGVNLVNKKFLDKNILGKCTLFAKNFLAPQKLDLKL